MKYALSFLAGTVFATATIIMAGGRASGMLALGVLLTISLAAGILYWVGVRRFARFLNAFMDGIEKTTVETAPVVADPLSADISSALRNQGVPKKAADAAAAAACKTNREFDPAFRAALKLLPKAA